MPMERYPDLLYGCVTHVPLWLEFPSYVRPIYLGQTQRSGSFNLRDLAPEWEEHHPILGGTVGTFALKNLLLRHPSNIRRVGICQYRKFVSRKRISATPEPTYPVMDRVFKGDLSAGVLAAAIDPGAQDFLISKPFPFPGGIDVLEQYKRSHHVEDLLKFTAQAVELGVLHQDEVASFFGQKVFFPGGLELGIYPSDFWLRNVTAIESVVGACLKNYTTRRRDYQTRVWSFCAERLGSYLLLKHFLDDDKGRAWARQFKWSQSWIWRHRYVGQMNVATEEDGGRYALGTTHASS